MDVVIWIITNGNAIISINNKDILRVVVGYAFGNQLVMPN
jgi:hypothetical protein